MDSDYSGRTRESARLFARASELFAGGVSHNARYYSPYPLFVSRAKGQHLWDVDGNRYVDYWMGHMALILGHSPGMVVKEVARQVKEGTHFGMGSRLSVELGEEISSAVPCAEMMRFCNSGAEATMYAVRLVRAFTGRKVIVKMRGGWHGYNTDLNTGVHSPFRGPEGKGILPEEQAHVSVATFNDPLSLRKAVKEHRGDVAAILLEPVLGAGGCLPADLEFVKEAREMTEHEGALLVFDEIITGFRLAFGGAQEYYGVRPDIATLGKIVGGGFPIGVVCGRKEIVSMASPRYGREYVSIGGGTFSENPVTMTAGLATVRHLKRHRKEIYPGLEAKGNSLRRGVDEAMENEGLKAKTTGAGSLFLTHFPSDRKSGSRQSEDEVKRQYSLFMMSGGGFILPGHPGGISTAHTQADVASWVRQSASFAKFLQNRRRASG